MNPVILKLAQNPDRTQDENQTDDHANYPADDHIPNNYFNHRFYDKPSQSRSDRFRVR